MSKRRGDSGSSRVARHGASGKPITRLSVFYQDDGEAEKIGGLAMDEAGVVHFQYETSWLTAARELSPQNLPIAMGSEVRAAPHKRKMHGLHGLFADSLPDAWGMKVLDRRMRGSGADMLRVGALDRLAYLGDGTMGALTYRPALDASRFDREAISLDELAAQAESLYEEKVAIDGSAFEGTPAEPAPSVIDGLEQAAGSAGGAQPKVLIAADKRGDRIVLGTSSSPRLTSYLLKFTPRQGARGLRTDCGPLEHAYALMAANAGIDIPATRLFPSTDGRLHFAATRFDRTTSGGRRHIHTLGGLLDREASDEGDYDELFRAARALSGSAQALPEVLLRLCFNVAALNDDDHLKNVAFLLDPQDGWRLAPAYDVTFSPSRSGERGMSVDGKYLDVSWQTVEMLSAVHGISKQTYDEIRARVERSLARWPHFAKRAEVPTESITEISDAIAGRRARLQA